MSEFPNISNTLLIFCNTPDADCAAKISRELVERRLAARGLGRDATVVVICRSGDRSAVAADMLAKGGFAHVWSVVDGFEGDLAKEGPEAGHRVVNGWKNKGLPWGYRLDKAKMYRISD